MNIRSTTQSKYRMEFYYWNVYAHPNSSMAKQMLSKRLYSNGRDSFYSNTAIKHHQKRGLFYTLKWSRLFINAKKIKVECTLIQSHSVALKLWHSERKLQRWFIRNPFCFHNTSVAFVHRGILSTRSIKLQKPIPEASEIKTCFVSQKL
jgi:hypothetical protein